MDVSIFDIYRPSTQKASAMTKALADSKNELEQNKKLLRALLGGLSEGVYIVGEDYTLHMVNPAEAGKYGVEPTEAVGKKYYDIFSRGVKCPDCPAKAIFEDKEVLLYDFVQKGKVNHKIFTKNAYYGTSFIRKKTKMRPVSLSGSD